MRLILVASALLLAAAPGTASQKHNSVPEATPTGKPVDCLHLTQLRETKVRDGQTIDFIMRNGQVYRNTLDAGTCPGLAFEKRFSHKTTINDICSTDVITVLESPGIRRGASCGLGKFQPVKLVKAH